jgi:GNS1/SUR4 family
MVDLEVGNPVKQNVMFAGGSLHTLRQVATVRCGCWRVLSNGCYVMMSAMSAALYAQMQPQHGDSMQTGRRTNCSLPLLNTDFNIAKTDTTHACAAYYSAALNSLVHVVMYTYYLLASTVGKDEKTRRKYLWWGRYLTMFQMAQFVSMLAQVRFQDICVNVLVACMCLRTADWPKGEKPCSLQMSAAQWSCQERAQHAVLCAYHSCCALTGRRQLQSPLECPHTYLQN